MDQDRDGTISVDDLKEVYSSLGILIKLFFMNFKINIISYYPIT